MEILKIAAITVMGIATLIIVLIALFSKKLIRFILLNMLLGIGALIAVNLISRFSGVSIPVNWYTVLSGGVFGLPAMVGILLLNVFM